MTLLTESIPQDPAEPIYTSRIIKASALIADTKVLLAEWDPDLPVAENIARARRTNIFGKAARKRVDDILVIFRQRYFDHPDVGATLVILVQGNAPAQWIDPLLYFFAAENDRTLRDTVIEVIYPRHLAGHVGLPTEYLARNIRRWVSEQKTTTAWRDETVERTAQGIQATLRDFGVLKGTARKEIAPIYLPNQTFALVAFWLDQHLHSGNLVLHSEEWKLFFLPLAGVERFFIETHQEHLLSYNAAGSVVRLDFPVKTLPEYARFMLEKEKQRDEF